MTDFDPTRHSIGWIGASFYFVWLDIAFRPRDKMNPGVSGTVWMVHGGGFYKVDNIDKLGTVVLLDASFEWIHNRLKTAKNAKAKLAKRPLFSKEKAAKKLYKERESAYKKVADVVVNVENKSLEEVITEIAKKCKI